jgi:hypothetical protein
MRLFPPTAIGLSPSKARARYRLHTAAMVLLFLASWSLFFRLTLNATVNELRLARAPQYTAVVEPEISGGHGHALLLHWTGANGTVRYGTADPEKHYRLGQNVRVLDYSTATCRQWETADTAPVNVGAIVSAIFLIPAAAIIAYVLYRRRWWLSVLRSTKSRRYRGRVTGAYELGHQKGLTVDLDGETVHVPLLRDQYVTALTSLDALKPLWTDEGRAIPFLLPSAGRVVWPAGRYRHRLVPVEAIVGRVLWVGGPSLMALVVHLFQMPISPC